LSETEQYPQATVEAETMLSLAQQQQRPQEEQTAIEGLINYLKERAPAGG
jgi:hypothetical protein